MLDRIAPYMAPGVTLQDALRMAWLDSIPKELRKPADKPADKPAKIQPRLNSVTDEKLAEVIRLRKQGLTYLEIKDKLEAGA